MKLLKKQFGRNTYEEFRAGSGLDLKGIINRCNGDLSIMDYEDLIRETEEMNDCNDTDYTFVEYFNSHDRNATGCSDINREIDEMDIENLKAGKAIIIHGLASNCEAALAFIDNKDNEVEIVNGLNDIFDNIYDGEYRVELEEGEF